jgi:3-(3-hydroxy-phenyl)propionate hydroxylase
MDRKLREQGVVDIRYGTELVSAAQDRAGVTITVRDAGGARDIGGLFLIAADGGSSTVREQLGLPFDGTIYPERTVLVTTPFPFQDHIPGLSSVSYCWQEKGNFSLLQLPDQWRASLYFPSDLTPEAALAEARIQSQLQDMCPTGEPFEITDKRVYRVHQRIVPRYDHGRIVLTGDAAHLNSPSGGMGMNGGLHDAHNLTEKIDEIWQGADYAELFDLYSRQRQPIAEEQILKQADQNRKRMTEKDPSKRRQSLDEMRAITEDPVRYKSFLMKSSMIEGIRRAAAMT